MELQDSKAKTVQLQTRVAELEAEARMRMADVAAKDRELAKSAEQVRVEKEKAAKAAEESAGLRARLDEQDSAAAKYSETVFLKEIALVEAEQRASDAEELAAELQRAEADVSTSLKGKTTEL